MTRRRHLLVVALCAVALLGASGCKSGGSVQSGSSDTPADYVYVIPEGTADRIARGETVEIMPSTLTVKVGEVVRIENRDDEGTNAGPFYAPAKTTITQRFDTAGSFVGDCAISPDGRYEIVVEE